MHGNRKFDPQNVSVSRTGSFSLINSVTYCEDYHNGKWTRLHRDKTWKPSFYSLLKFKTKMRSTKSEFGTTTKRAGIRRQSENGGVLEVSLCPGRGTGGLAGILSTFVLPTRNKNHCFYSSQTVKHVQISLIKLLKKTCNACVYS